VRLSALRVISRRKPARIGAWTRCPASHASDTIAHVLRHPADPFTSEGDNVHVRPSGFAFLPTRSPSSVARPPANEATQCRSEGDSSNRNAVQPSECASRPRSFAVTVTRTPAPPAPCGFRACPPLYGSQTFLAAEQCRHSQTVTAAEAGEAPLAHHPRQPRSCGSG